MSLKSVLFDFDGVLVDTEGVYTDFWNAVDLRYPTHIDGFALKIKGTTLPNILSTYFDKRVHPDILSMLSGLEENMTYNMFDGAERLLASLAENGIRSAIVTSSNKPKMDFVFKVQPAFKKYVGVLVTDEDVTASKPDPQGYLLAARRLGVSPDECVVIEDSINGLKAGCASGARVVGLATTNTRSDIESLSDIVADDISGIDVAVLRSLFED